MERLLFFRRAQLKWWTGNVGRMSLRPDSLALWVLVSARPLATILQSGKGAEATPQNALPLREWTLPRSRDGRYSGICGLCGAAEASWATEAAASQAASWRPPVATLTFRLVLSCN